MLSKIHKTNPFSTFPVDLQNAFDEQKSKLNTFLELQEGEKIGKDSEGNYYKFSNSYSQLAFRYWYGENREKTINYLDQDLGEYINFLDRLMGKIEGDVLSVYKNFGKKVQEYNSGLIEGLYTLKKTYEEQRFTSGDKKQITAKIDSIIMTLIDFKDKISNTRDDNDNKMTTLLNINTNLNSFEI